MKDKRENIEAFYNHLAGEAYVFKSWRRARPEQRESISYSELEWLRKGDKYPDSEMFFVPKYCAGSDYSGCDVELSNFEILKELIDKEKIPGCFEVYGPYGSYGIAIRFDVRHEELFDILEGLEEYPAIDDEAVSFKAMELQDEAWENDIRSDYVREIEKIHGVEFGEQDNAEIRQVFEETAARINEYWQIETGGQAYIDMEEIAKATCISDFKLSAFTGEDHE